MSVPLQLPEWLSEFLASLGTIWNIGSLDDRLTLMFSKRMIRSLGNYRPDSGVIRLNKTLADPRNEKVLREVLCHEAAHAAVLFLYGRGCKPHGPEWRALVEAAQYPPRAQIPQKEVHGRPHTVKKKGYRYTHRCLDCGKIFHSRRTDRRWRCKQCLNLGLDGFLKLVRRKAV